MSAFLTLKQLNSFKTELLELRQQLISELQVETQGRLMAGAGSSRIADEDASEFVASVQTELAACQAALSRLEQGCFGHCVRCGEEIELSLLVASPSISCCLRCQAVNSK
ncbi:TraR/DksA family transcriptional regulator [Pontibacter sp. JAM-7]|uniref:TraR/DksA family transcriptional regulator n=1 Tax=Pontibacter sp. JAM-7 TaxID=3366581 RepID=UPI003AF59B05